MSFRKLRQVSLARRELLPFVNSLEDHDILIAIGAADELNAPIGYKQLGLLQLASPTTLQRRLKALVANRTILKGTQPDDGRRVSYSLSKRTLAAYQDFIRNMFAK